MKQLKKHPLSEQIKVTKEDFSKVGMPISMGKVTGSYSLFIGRYQPFHDGHETLIRSVLNEGKNVCIALRDTPQTDSDPYDYDTRKGMITQRFAPEIIDGKVVIIKIPDIAEVCYGRKVGWGIREIKLSDDVESISATKIRSEK